MASPAFITKLIDMRLQTCREGTSYKDNFVTEASLDNRIQPLASSQCVGRLARGHPFKAAVYLQSNLAKAVEIHTK